MQPKGFEVAVAKTTAIEHLNFQVDPFGKAIIEASREVIEDLLPPVAQSADKLFQRLEWQDFHLHHPILQLFFSFLFFEGLIE